MHRIRNYIVEIGLIGALLVAVAFFGYLGYGLLRPEIVDERFDGARALASAGDIMEFGPRSSGTEANLKAGDWLIEQLRLLGWDVVIQPYAVSETVNARNIIAIRSHSAIGAPVAIVAGYYDSRLVADADPDPARQLDPAPGANAGASTVAVMLELARTLYLDAAGRTVCLVFADGDANGGLPGWEAGLGSSVLVENLGESVPRCAGAEFVVALDQVGAKNQRFAPNSDDDDAVRERIRAAAVTLDLAEWFPASPAGPPNARTAAFRAAGMPVALLNSENYPYAGTAGDTLDQLDGDSLERVGQVLEYLLEQVVR